MTKRVPLSEKRRPRRELGQLLRIYLCCPLCRGEINVIAYRTRTVRLCCSVCELRFSVDPIVVTHTMIRTPEKLANAHAQTLAMISVFSGRFEQVVDAEYSSEDEKTAALRDQMHNLLGEEGMRGFEAEARARGAWEAFLERIEARNNGPVANGQDGS